MTVAVVAHAEKTLGGGLPELRRALEAAGVEEPLWYEVPKAKKASEQAERALDEGAELVFAWGGDGTVRRCVDVLCGTEARLAVIPAGTANLFATNLGIPRDIEQAVDIGLSGDRRKLDVGRFGDERFAVMAGAGFDAAMIRDADGLKQRIGRAAYLWSGARNLRSDGFGAELEVDGSDWYEGSVTCILLGNLGDIFGGVEVFPDARPDDGMLELGVVTAQGLLAVDADADAHGGRRPQPIPVRADHEGQVGTRSNSTGRSVTSSTEATGARSGHSMSKSRLARSTCASRDRARRRAEWITT